MPAREIPFVNGEYYHIFNRGVAKLPTFLNSRDYSRFIKTMLYYQIDDIKPKFSIFSPLTRKLETNKKVVEIVCYCLMPNHYHLLLKQSKEGGISEFISKISNSYTKYFNTKNQRVGPLFQGQFKAVHVEDNEQLLHLSRYIHLNPLVSLLVKNIESYTWSSFHEYININNSGFCSKEIITDQFPSLEGYQRFLSDREDYGKRLEAIKHKVLE